MKKFVILFCIFFSLRMNVSALSFSASALDSSLSETGRLASFPFGAGEQSREEDEQKAEDMFVALVAVGIIVLGVCYYWLNTVRFFDYPYDEEASPADGSYIARGSLGESFLYTDPGYNRTMFTLDTSAVYLHGFGFGNETRFEGLLFPYIGPYFENLALYNVQKGDFDCAEKGFRNNVRLGGQLSLLQTNILSANLVVQYVSWAGEHFDDYKNGYGVGILLRSYPIRPLVLEWKFCSQNYSDGFSVFESNLQVGFTRGRYEFFAAWKHLGFSNNDDDEFLGSTDGVSLGARVYFSLY